MYVQGVQDSVSSGKSKMLGNQTRESLAKTLSEIITIVVYYKPLSWKGLQELLQF